MGRRAGKSLLTSAYTFPFPYLLLLLLLPSVLPPPFYRLSNQSSPTFVHNHMKQTSEAKSGMSSLQLALLKVYALEPTPQEMNDVQQWLGQYFGEKLASKVGEQAKQKGITEDDLDQWLNEDS